METESLEIGSENGVACVNLSTIVAPPINSALHHRHDDLSSGSVVFYGQSGDSIHPLIGAAPVAGR